MKLQTTKTNIKNNFYTVLTAGYCELQYLLNYCSPFAYSAGIYGCACDYYTPSDKFRGVCLATGYNTDRLGGKRVSYELVKEYEQKAREIVCNYETQMNKREALNNLIDEFIEKALNEKTKK